MFYELLIVSACLETTEGCKHLSDFYFKHKGYTDLYEEFTKRHKERIDMASPFIILGSFFTEKKIHFRYRPLTVEIKPEGYRVGFNYDF